MDLKNNIKGFQNKLKDKDCTLVAVSKTKPEEVIMEAYNEGLRVFGENKIQELVTKYESLPKDIEWHMIGHLQRNKVKYIASFIGLIHSIDSLKLLKEVDKQAAKHDRVIPCLLQMHIAEESTKFGLSAEELKVLLASEEFATMEHIKIVGLMGMATNTDNTDQVRREFADLKSLFSGIQSEYQNDKVQMSALSMGMSGDFEIALEEGSNMIRVGSAIFGARNYN
ncbi:MAG: YggS family pyridoxal phosphate-dependent enzyme [Bacteroidota bacterium]